jgi:UDP-3-O-[3-hydroxymyristoyl] glucosamine N-acyltransferase
MPDYRFFEPAGPVALNVLARECGVEIDPAFAELQIFEAAPLARSNERSVSFCVGRPHRADLEATKAAAVFVPASFSDATPKGVVALVTGSPQAAWARAAALLHRPRSLDNEAPVHPTAELEDGVHLGFGAVVGAGARIGRGTVVGPNSVIGPGVAIGRDCVIGANVSVAFALIGDRVRLLSGAVIGEAGFGVAGSAEGALDVPQLGRVILQDGVSIGANSCVDRGAYDDTVVGENTKIDNLVQIAHNVVIGRNCVLAAHSGISGSTQIGDNVMCGGAVGMADHITVGDGARLAARAGVAWSVPAGETWGGYPAKPVRQWMRETAWLSRKAAKRNEDDKE